MKKYIFAAISLVSLVSVSAQTLSEEVVIDREITPVVRHSVRPSWVNPIMLTPRVESKSLTFNEYLGTAEINRSLTPLDPVNWADSVARSPYRGYASLGYFPAFNLGAGVGYRLVRNRNIDAGVRLSYDGASWNGYDGAESKYKQNSFLIGADASLRFRPGILTAYADYTFALSDMARYPQFFCRGPQSINMFDLGLKWVPTKERKIFDWNLAFKFNYGGFTKDKSLEMARFIPNASFSFNPVHDLVFDINSDLFYQMREKSGIALGVGLKFRHVNNLRTLKAVSAFSEGLDTNYAFAEPVDDGSSTMSVITLSPGYKFSRSNISGKIGVRLDINAGGNHGNVHFAPDIDLQWNSGSKFGAFLHATGGEVLNTNSDLWNRSPWMTGVLSMERSHVNADITLGLSFGSYKGFRAALYGGWSSVSDWAIPVNLQDVDMWALRKSFDGFNYGLELGYTWNRYLELELTVAGATPGKYYKWQDNAKHVFNIAAKSNPIDKLHVEAGFALRTGRSSFRLNPVTDGTSAWFVFAPVSMRNAANLFVGADYELTKSLGIFVKVENLLNRHWQLTSDVRSQGIHGLFGAQLKF